MIKVSSLYSTKKKCAKIAQFVIGKKPMQRNMNPKLNTRVCEGNGYFFFHQN